jgi:hypothetical protein
LFKVPETFRIHEGRLKSNASFGNNGAFKIPTPAKFGIKYLFIIASDGLGWEHVSVHVTKGNEILTPLWDDMVYVKELFWDPEDVVMQLHPRASEYVNNHPHTLHLWRPVIADIPTPPSILVGVK